MVGSPRRIVSGEFIPLPSKGLEMATGGKKPTKTRLGRGLGSLIRTPVSLDPPPSEPEVSTAGIAADVGATTSSPTAPGLGVRMLPVHEITPNQHQPRQRFDDESIAQLAASIESAGLMQPIVVRPGASGFELVAGERRWRAFQSLGKTEIPAIVRAVDHQTAAEWALIENLQREDLDPLERADGLARLMEEFGLSASEAARQVGLERSTVANLLRLRDADGPLREAIIAGLVTQGHAKALLGVGDLAVRASLLERCVREGWSVRETERRVHAVGKGAAPESGSAKSPASRSAHVEDLEKRLATHLGTKVSIKLGRQKGRGKMTLEFYSLQQFDGLLERIGFDPDTES